VEGGGGEERGEISEVEALLPRKVLWHMHLNAAPAAGRPACMHTHTFLSPSRCAAASSCFAFTSTLLRARLCGRRVAQVDAAPAGCWHCYAAPAAWAHSAACSAPIAAACTHLPLASEKP